MKIKNATFFEGIMIAIISSFIGSIAYFALSTIFSDSIIIRLLISGFGLAYLLYLLSRSRERIGRISVILIWSVMVITLWFFWPPITLFILFHMIAIWLVRSLYFYSSLFSALADLSLHGLSIAAAFWAASHTGSLFLTIWCFFLTQALFVLIPTQLSSKSNKSIPINNDAQFQRAYQAADAAVRKLSTHS